MTSLQKKYFGSQGKYFSPENMDPKTFESEYLDTKSLSVMWSAVEEKDAIPENIKNNYKHICEMFKQNPFKYAETYVQMKQEYKKEGLWELLVHTNNKPKSKPNVVTLEIDSGNTREDIGYTGLYFVGDPLAVASITLEIGYIFDTIYPSITGQFDTFHLFTSVIPNPVYHKKRLHIEFLKEDAPLEVSYQRVVLQSTVPFYEAFYRSTRFAEAKDSKKGAGKVLLPFNHPVETIQIFSKAPLSNTVLTLDNLYRLHVPFKGLQNKLYLYEISFNCLLNFSRVEKAFFEFTTEEDTCVYPFAKAWNVGQFVKGMAGLAFAN